MDHANHINGLSLNASSHTLLVWVLIGLVAGYITGKLMKGSGFGPLMDIVVGIVGALIGGFLGAVLFTFLLRLVTGRRSRLF
jgi:uncharacterized membrane protein YeaQ/YmgE (transglycosylase-associated protein family)